MPKYIDGYPDNYSGNDLKADGQWAVGNPGPAPTDTEIVEWLERNALRATYHRRTFGCVVVIDYGRHNRYPSSTHGETLRLAVIAAMKAEKGSK